MHAPVKYPDLEVTPSDSNSLWCWWQLKTFLKLRVKNTDVIMVDIVLSQPTCMQMKIDDRARFRMTN